MEIQTKYAKEEQELSLELPSDGLSEDGPFVQLQKVKLEHTGNGTLSLTKRKLEFHRKRGLFSRPELELSIDLTAIKTANIDYHRNILLIEWNNENNECSIRRLYLPKNSNSVTLFDSLNSILERIKMHTHEQEQKKHYHQALRLITYNIWMLAECLLQIANDLSNENWDNIDISLNEAKALVKKLSSECRLDITSHSSIIKAVASRNALLVYKNIESLLESIGIVFKNKSIPINTWGEIVSQHRSGIDWHDIGFVYLFAGQYYSLPLLKNVGDTGLIEDSLSRLGSLKSTISAILCKDFPSDAPTSENENKHDYLPNEEKLFKKDLLFSYDNTSTNLDEFATAVENFLKKKADISL